jgi:hypothetical protein
MRGRNRSIEGPAADLAPGTSRARGIIRAEGIAIDARFGAASLSAARRATPLRLECARVVVHESAIAQSRLVQRVTSSSLDMFVARSGPRPVSPGLSLIRRSRPPSKRPATG